MITRYKFESFSGENKIDQYPELKLLVNPHLVKKIHSEINNDNSVWFDITKNLSVQVYKDEKGIYKVNFHKGKDIPPHDSKLFSNLKTAISFIRNELGIKEREAYKLIGDEKEFLFEQYESKQIKENIEEYNYKIPVWAISALTDGDISGLEDDEIKLVKNFESNLPGKGSWDFNYEEYFSSYNDITNLGGNVVDAKYTVFEQYESKHIEENKTTIKNFYLKDLEFKDLSNTQWNNCIQFDGLKGEIIRFFPDSNDTNWNDIYYDFFISGIHTKNELNELLNKYPDIKGDLETYVYESKHIEEYLAKYGEIVLENSNIALSNLLVNVMRYPERFGNIDGYYESQIINENYGSNIKNINVGKDNTGLFYEINGAKTYIKSKRYKKENFDEESPEYIFDTYINGNISDVRKIIAGDIKLYNDVLNYLDEIGISKDEIVKFRNIFGK